MGMVMQVSAEGARLNVDLALVLAVDVSDSISAEELRLQRDGYVTAFRDPHIANAIATGGIGRIAVLYLEWAGPDHHRVLRPWTVLASPQDAATFASALGTEPLATESFGSRRAMSFGEHLDPPPISTATATSISAGLLVALKQFDHLHLRADRLVIDVSGDGTNNAGPALAPVRDLIIERGIVINGLPLTWTMADQADAFASFGETFLTRYYENFVIGGPGAFVIAANDISHFAEAVRRKLILEIVELKVPGRSTRAQRDSGYSIAGLRAGER
jgi:hypothetical protein